MRKQRALYDLVVCFATLHYIKEIERAVKNLFELVNSEGYLIFNYPKPRDEYMKKRFALVLAGENLISLRKINIVLGSRPKEFYSPIRANIYVLIRKSR